jgi:hypothetical protein
LTIGLGFFFTACSSVILIVRFAVPGGIKSLGSFPNGFAFSAAILLSLYLSATVAGRVWKAGD